MESVSENITDIATRLPELAQLSANVFQSQHAVIPSSEW